MTLKVVFERMECSLRLHLHLRMQSMLSIELGSYHGIYQGQQLDEGSRSCIADRLPDASFLLARWKSLPLDNPLDPDHKVEEKV